MAGRKADPNTRYRVFIHTVADKYSYATVQQPYMPMGGTRLKYKPVHIGTIDKQSVFTPNTLFRLLPVSERLKFIFPDGIDISRASELNHPDYTGQASEENLAEAPPATQEANAEAPKEPMPCENTLDQYNNRLYGSFWLLEQILREKGIYDDLLETFEGNIAQVHEVMSLSIFPYLSGKCFSRFAKWQNSHKTLLDYQLPSQEITRLAQSITEGHRMKLISLRLARQPKGAILDCDSTTR